MSADLVLVIVAVLAGAVSVLTPCVLVMLPVVLGVVAGGGRRRAWGVVVGVEISFIGISLLLGAALAAAGLPARTTEYVAAAIILAFGLVLLVPRLRHGFELVTSRAVGTLTRGATAVRTRLRRGRGERATGPDDGFRGGVAGGLGLGLVWAPCAGPILASVAVAGNSGGFGTRSVIVALAYGAGMFFPLLAVMFGGRAVAGRARRLVGGRRLDVAMGSMLVVMAVVISTGEATRFNRVVAERVGLTSTPIASVEARALDRANGRSAGADREGAELPSAAVLARDGYPATPGAAGLVELGPAPAFTGVQRWHNTPGGEALAPADLRGKVVLVDFWTYSCINCLRTLPYLRSWYREYADDGLVIVGVHTPEFAFEKDEGNVARAISDLDVEWPVATDPDYRTWNAFSNRFWPAKYLIDRDGTIRYVHYGEGEYEVTEERIREALGLDSDASEAEAPADADEPSRSDPRQPVTPETYLGVERTSAAQYRGVELEAGFVTVVRDTPARYRPVRGVAGLGPDEWSLVGRWQVEDERSTAAGAGSQVVIRYRARDVFLVLSPPAGGAGTVTVRDDGGGVGSATRRIRVDGHRLYTLRSSLQRGDGLMTVTLDPGVSAYAFTFG